MTNLLLYKITLNVKCDIVLSRMFVYASIAETGERGPLPVSEKISAEYRKDADGCSPASSTNAKESTLLTMR